MLEGEMMQGIVPNIIKQIAHHEAREKRGDQHWTKHQTKRPIEQKCQRNAKWDWHNQPVAIARIIVVHTMRQEMDALTQFAWWTIMKHKAMQSILGK